METQAALPMPPATRHQLFSFTRVGAITANTFLELVRLKVFYFLLLFALLLIGSSAFMAQFTFQERFQVLKDISLGAMSIFTWLLGVLATAMLLPKDIEDRTLYTILAKPVPRFEYLLGKLLGVLGLIAIALAFMVALFAGVLYIAQEIAIGEVTRGTAPEDLSVAIAQVRADTFTSNLIFGIIIIYAKSALLASFTLFLSTFATSSIFTILISMVVYLIGHIQGVARDSLMVDNPGLYTKILLMVVALLFPDLQLFSLVDDIIVGAVVPLGLFLKTLGLGITYTLIYFFAGYFFFAWKEL